MFEACKDLFLEKCIKCALFFFIFRSGRDVTVYELELQPSFSSKKGKIILL